MNDVFFRVCIAAFTMFVLCLSQAPDAKSSYPDGNWTESPPTSHNCMRCHMAKLNPAGVNLTLASSKATIAPGEQVNVSVTRSGFGATWKPGFIIAASLPGQYGSPVTFGWSVVASPAGNNFCYVNAINFPASTLTWVLAAPKRPGAYTIAASAFFNDGTATDALPGTKRGNNTLTITVGRAAETTKPQLLSSGVASRYGIYLFLRFSEPIDAATAVNTANYSIINKVTGNPLAVQGAAISYDGLTITLKTNRHETGATYTVTVRNLKDYASSPNTIDQVSRTYTPDLTSPLMVPVEFTQDATSSKIMQYDEVEYLGKDSLGGINRINFCWTMSDFLTGIDYDSAKIVLRQMKTTAASATAQQFDLYRLAPANDWTQAFGNNVSVAFLWSGANQGSQPVASISQPVAVVNAGTPQTEWSIDITNDFRVRYQTPPASGTNQAEYFVRLKAANESATAPGAGFYGSDAADGTSMPYIKLILKKTQTTIASRRSAQTAGRTDKIRMVRSAKGMRFILNRAAAVSGKATLSVYSLKGEIVAVLPLVWSEESHSLSALWQRSNRQGAAQSEGQYVAVLNGRDSRYGAVIGNIVGENR